jgi:hypothetical protein
VYLDFELFLSMLDRNAITGGYAISFCVDKLVKDVDLILKNG